MVIVREVEAGDTETEIIEPHETPSNKNRYFGVSNGDNEIRATAWGSTDGDTWVEKDSKVIAANEADTLVVGPTVDWVKLTGKTTTPDTSIVQACLYS